MKADDGGPMFPLVMPASGGGKCVPGISVRMWLAGQALSGMLANSENTKQFLAISDDTDRNEEQLPAKNALVYADTLIAKGKAAATPDEGALQPGNEAWLIFSVSELPGAEAWRNMSGSARREWNRRFILFGNVSARCLTCGYPTNEEQGSCVSCNKDFYK